MKYSLLIILLTVFFSCKNEKRKSSTVTLTTNSYFKKAKEYQEKKISDSSFYYFNLAKNAFLIDNDSLGVARALVNMAIIQSDKGDYYGSIETSLRANQFFKNEKETDSIVKLVLASNYNNLAISSSNLKNFDSAISYYNKALKYVNVEENRFIYYNNIGDALISQKKFTLAKKYLNLALASKDNIDYARALNNLARAKFLENKTYNPLPELFKALEIRKKENNSWAENSSYATLADYFYNKDQNTSLMYAKMMLEKAIQNKSADDQLEALQKIIILDKTYYLKNFLKFQSINDSVQTARNKDKDQFAVFRYDIDVKTAENEMLKVVSAENKNRNLLLLIALFFAIIIIIWYRKKQKQLKQEKELEVKNTQLKMSKKVHDKVANKVYHVMSEVENTSDMDKDILLDKLESIYHISRDISYEDKDLVLENSFSQQLSQMLKSYASETIMIPTIGNEESLWNDVPDKSKIEIFYILQELMTNMRKHSQADRVIINFERINNFIHILYSDNGVGIKLLSPKNGVRNTETRINSIGGTINFDTKTEKGLKITLSFPVKN
ncbi:tetratricopeptide repeat-containing sensor histidine kinase [Chryseobacterium populi]|uniref:Histidine kinase n=1 Tax=Chryseobacterium populi TaxID=1144316 RepID=J2K0Y2_9FLAO|nr:tetratricopeptide repeat-containing sensor histidine kinase [Chryseobacterium populi]EJL73810.1 histidine kinase [Chryseobacterium populi]